METFLQILGIVFLVILAIIGLALLWVAWKVWGWWRQFQVLARSMGSLAAGAVPPFRVKLEPVDEPTWADRDQIEYLAGPLRVAGFVDLGLFDVTPSPLRLMALASAEENIYASIYQDPESGVYLDLVTAYEDGTYCTYSTARQAGLLDTPPFKTVKSLPELSAADLLQRFLAERPKQAMLPATANAFPALFESFWARDFDWRIARGGITEDEIRRLQSLGGDRLPDEATQMIKLQWTGAIRAYYDEQLHERFLASGHFSAQEWEKIRHRVRFIYDKLDWDSLLASCGVHPDGCEEDENQQQNPKQRSLQAEAERLAAALPPREAFAQINALLPARKQAKKLTEVAEPIAADVYLMPDWSSMGIDNTAQENE